MNSKVFESTKARSKKRVILTIPQKIEILKLLDEGATAKYVANLYNIGNRTVYDIRDNRQKLLQYYLNADCSKGIANRKRMREALLADLDAILYEWFRQRRSENIPITRLILCEKAKELHKELKVEIPCDYSRGWLTKNLKIDMAYSM